MLVSRVQVPKQRAVSGVHWSVALGFVCAGTSFWQESSGLKVAVLGGRLGFGRKRPL